MRRFIIPLVTAAVVVSIILAGCVPEAAPPVTPPVEPPVTPPVTQRGWPQEVIYPPENPFEGLGIKPDGTPYTVHHLSFSSTHPCGMFCDSIFLDYSRRAGCTGTDHSIPYDPMGQLAIVEDIYLMQPDALILWSIEEAMMLPILEKYQAAGIDVYQEDHEILSPAIIGCSRHSGIGLGRAGGFRCIERARELNITYKALLVHGYLGATPGIVRPLGFQTIAYDNPQWLQVIAETPECMWNDAPAADAVMAMLPANPEINCIFEAGGMLGGVIEGLRSIGQLYPVGHPDHIFVTGLNDDGRAPEYIEEGWIDGAIEHSTYKTCGNSFKMFLLHTCMGQTLPERDVVLDSVVYDQSFIGTEAWNLSWDVLKYEGVAVEDYPLIDWGYLGIPGLD